VRGWRRVVSSRGAGEGRQMLVCCVCVCEGLLVRVCLCPAVWLLCQLLCVF
jgi:hypothetical protein